MKNFNSFINEILEKQQQLNLGPDEECLFRGHSDAGYRLIPNIYRGKDYSLKNEESIFYEFRSKAVEIQNRSFSDWDVLFHMQHYGCKTRILDWTDNLGTALYFALSAYEKGKKPTVFLLNPFALNVCKTRHRDFYDPDHLDHKNGYSFRGMLQRQIDEPENTASGIWWKYPLAVYPVRKSGRLISQDGYFTIQGSDSDPLDVQIPEDENIWKKVEIPEEIIPGAFAYLKLFGINEFTMFPDLQNLSKFLNKKYNL